MELRNRALGRWHGILAALGIDAQYLRNRHGPCPGCGGRDRFRWDDKNGNGTFYCSGGGDAISGSGFDLVMHTFNCDFAQAAKMVEEALGGRRDPVIPKRSPPPAKSETYSKARRIWMKAQTDDALVASHPYAQLKGIDRAYGAARGRVSGGLLGQDADCLVIPLKTPSGEFKGVECIGQPRWSADKKKHVTPKQTFGSKGVLMLGNTLDETLPVYICEGWADAVSLWRMNGNVCVIAVFGGVKRQLFYATLFDEKSPNRKYIVVEDAA